MLVQTGATVMLMAALAAPAPAIDYGDALEACGYDKLCAEAMMNHENEFAYPQGNPNDPENEYSSPEGAPSEPEQEDVPSEPEQGDVPSEPEQGDVPSEPEQTDPSPADDGSSWLVNPFLAGGFLGRGIAIPM